MLCTCHAQPEHKTSSTYSKSIILNLKIITGTTLYMILNSLGHQLKLQCALKSYSFSNFQFIKKQLKALLCFGLPNA